MFTKICNFDVNQNDIAHRVLEIETAPATSLFNRKADSINFYGKKKKLLKVQDNHIVKPNNENHSDSEVTLPGLERVNSHIYMNKSLPSINRMLLREVRMESRMLKYQFPGNTVNGQMRVKKSKSSEYISINSKQASINITKNLAG